MYIFNEAKPKYEKLNELFEPILQNIRLSPKVNIIIDVKEITKKYFRPDINIVGERRLILEEISADILNIISHYRNYFYKKGKYTTFYFFYSYKKCDEILAKYPLYKEEYYKKYFDEDKEKAKIIFDAVRVVEKVILGLPNVYFIDTSKYDEFVYIKYLLSKVDKSDLSVILTNDALMNQLLKDNVYILTIKGIKSELISSENVIESITEKQYKFSSKLLPLIYAIAGNKKYGIKGVARIAVVRAADLIEKLIESGKIIDADSIEVPIKFSELDIKNKSEKQLIQNANIISNNYKEIRQDSKFSCNY